MIVVKRDDDVSHRPLTHPITEGIPVMNPLDASSPDYAHKSPCQDHVLPSCPISGPSPNRQWQTLIPSSSQLLWFSILLIFQGFLAVTLYSLSANKQSLNSYHFDQAVFRSECMHPMGGGKVASGGGFKPLNDTVVSDECAAELHLYFSKQAGQYWVDVARVAESARGYFDSLAAVEPPSLRNIIVFDIDETTLSNAEEWQQQLQRRQAQRGHHNCSRKQPPLQQQQQQSPYWRRWQMGSDLKQQMQEGVDAGTTSIGSMPASDAGTLQSGAGSSAVQPGIRLGKALAGSSDSPPLAPMLALYQYLYALGFSVTFITGRKESERNTTELNLLRAGYGKPCSKRLLDVSDLSSGTDKQQQHNSASVLGLGSQHRPVSACYTALHMREQNDNRFASVFKPSCRGELIDKGYRIYGNFGDQFSDLDGEYGAPHSFKLPNPSYLIL